MAGVVSRMWIYFAEVWFRESECFLNKTIERVFFPMKYIQIREFHRVRTIEVILQPRQAYDSEYFLEEYRNVMYVYSIIFSEWDHPFRAWHQTKLFFALNIFSAWKLAHASELFHFSCENSVATKPAYVPVSFFHSYGSFPTFSRKCHNFFRYFPITLLSNGLFPPDSWKLELCQIFLEAFPNVHFFGIQKDLSLSLLSSAVPRSMYQFGISLTWSFVFTLCIGVATRYVWFPTMCSRLTSAHISIAPEICILRVLPYSSCICNKVLFNCRIPSARTYESK